MVRTGRLLGALGALTIVAGACASTASTTESLGAGIGHLTGREASAPATPLGSTMPLVTPLAPKVTLVTPLVPATPFTPKVPPAAVTPLSSGSPSVIDPYETLVATVKPEVSILHTFEQPDGEPVHFEYALTNPTYFENDLVLMVTEESDDDRWLRVQIPIRPNGTEAWIRSADVMLSTHRYRAEVHLADRSVTVWNGEDVVAETGAVVGAESSPTPIGSFYVNELITKWEGSAYGPYILGLSAFSEALETFNGGIPVIAIHGTNRPELIGGAFSNGCIRIPNEVVAVLAEIVPMGTPVDILS